MCTYQCLIDCITISSPSLCVFLLVALLGGEDPVLINCTNLHWDRQELLVGLARSGGPAASMSWFIQMTSSKNSRNLLSAYLAVLISSPAQPQARGANLRWLWSSHVSHRGLTFHQPLWTAALTTTATCMETNCLLPPLFILLSASLPASPALPIPAQKKFTLHTGYKPHRYICTCIKKKWMECGRSILDIERLQKMELLREECQLLLPSKI